MYQISLNGLDGSGKTTQYSLLKKNFYYAYFSNDISKYNVFPDLKGDNFFRWWFLESSLDEFCDSIYKGIKLRNDDSLNQQKKIVFNDKGIFTFDCRILANFLLRGYSNENINQFIREYKSKYEIENEDLSVFLNVSDTSKLNSRRKNRNVDSRNSYDGYYEQYQNKLLEVTNGLLYQSDIKLINANDKIENVFKNLLNLFIGNEQQFIFVSGVSESGKSTASEYLSMKLPNAIHVKMRDISDELYRTSNSKEEKYIWMREQEKYSPYKFWFDFLMLTSAYTKNNQIIIMDTLHGISAAQYMKKILGDRLSILYIDALFNNRVNREYNKLKLKGENCSISDIAKRTEKKDIAKAKFGLLSIKKLPYTYILNNDDDFYSFEKKLDVFANYILGEQGKNKCVVKK